MAEQEKTLRQQVLEILNRGESWFDTKNNKQYTLANAHELPGEAEFTEGNPDEGKKALNVVNAEIYRLMQDREDLMKKHGLTGEPVKMSLVSEESAPAKTETTESKKSK